MSYHMNVMTDRYNQAHIHDEYYVYMHTIQLCILYQLPYCGKFSHGANFSIFRMKASVCENKECEIYANASTRTYVSTRGLN